MKQFTLPQVIVVVVVVFLIGTIVPSLLDASSDISVLLGVIIVVSVLFGIFRYGKKIVNMLGFDFDDDEKEGES